MNNILEIKNLSFSYGNKEIFNNFNLQINEGDFTTITGLNGSGKSTLIKIIVGLLPHEGDVFVDGIKLNPYNLKDIRRKIGVVFEYSDESFVADTVMDEIAFVLENINLSKEEIKSEVYDIAIKLGIENLLEKNPYELSNGEKQKVAIASVLVSNPKILILDEALTKINNLERDEILKIIKEHNQKNNMTVINVTHDMEESIFGNKIIVLNKGKIVLNGEKELVYKEENVFSKLGIDLPFMVKLSIKLQYYGLTDRVILNMDEMVDEVWK